MIFGTCFASTPLFSIFATTGPIFGAPLTVSGSYSIAAVPVATAEPSSVALMLSGVGLVFAMRKRLGAGLQQAR